jgi:hypothetical protein
MDANVRRLVRERAGGRCEYCRLPQVAFQFSTFHIEHIRAIQDGGSDLSSNLALACPHCNAKKGPNIATLSDTGELVQLFNPREQFWENHFAVVGFEIVGTTETGKATVELLGFNDGDRLELRAQLISEGLF